MKLLTNPIMLRMVLVLAAAVAAFLLGLFFIRRLRRNLAEEGTLPEAFPSSDSFPLQTYHAVIQQLKQQKHELQSLQQLERRRARTTENVSAAVLSNLSSGVLFFTGNGLVRQANAAAKQILGYASPAGMSSSEIFHHAKVFPAGGDSKTSLAQAVQASLHENTPARRMEVQFRTPAGEERILEITITSVLAPSGDVLGAACLINDETEMALIRRQQTLRGEMSAEMALRLRNSLSAISGYARQLAASHDLAAVRQLSTDIVSEAAQLDHTIGGFLAEARTARASAGT